MPFVSHTCFQMDDKIKQWVLINEDLVEYNTSIQGKSKKDDGYLGNIIYVTITGKTKNGIRKVWDLVLKSSKEGNVRSQLPLQDVFEKEIFIYNNVKTAFNEFQRKKGIEKPVDIMPYCYGTEATGKSELLMLENLKPKGYDVLDRKKSMTFDHVKIVLETYGKWHALSLALKYQEPQVFNELNKNSINGFSNIITKSKLVDFVLEKFENSKKYLDSVHDKEALVKMQFDRTDVKYILTDLFFEESSHQVILHGDCWSNNFLFKVDSISNKPLDIRIIDWQLSGVGSPVLDLSFFLYCCCSNEDLEDLNRLLKIYHDSLSSALTVLGGDAEEIFSFNTLKRHWKRFSRYGIVISALMLRFAFCDTEEAPDFAECANEGLEFLNVINFPIKNESGYFEKMKYNLLHFAKNA